MPKKNRSWIGIFLALLLLLSTAFPNGAVAVVGENDEREEGNSIIDRLKSSSEEKYQLSKNAISNDELKPSESELVIKYDRAIANSIHRQIGARVKQRVPALNYQIIELPDYMTMEEGIRTYMNVEGVVHATPSVPFKKMGQTDPKSELMYHLNQLNIPETRELAGDHEVVVAVVDTGLDRHHPELVNQVLPDYNALNPAQRGLADMHGTHVAGIIAAEAGNGIGGEGVNPNAKILPVDVFGRSFFGSDYIIAEGILYAVEQGADVINLSLGGMFPSPILTDAVKTAEAAGVVVVASAGNDASDHPNYPASDAGVISVGATNEARELAEFSSFGPSVDVVAPGEDIYAPVFDVDKHSSFVEMSGTSMSAPIVSGFVSLLLATYPDLTPYEVKYIIQQTADDIGEPGHDLIFGYGMANLEEMLQFDVSQLPEEPKKRDNLLSEASHLHFIEAFAVESDQITLPKEESHYRFNLDRGQYAQIVLEGHENYDYAIDLTTYSARGDHEQSINQVSAGETEGYLFASDERQTVILSIYDVFEKYDIDGESEFTLSVQVYDELKEDGINKENRVQVNQFPYETLEDEEGPYYLAGDGGDSDYFRFTAEEVNALELHLNGIPGLQPTALLYMADEFDRFNEEELEIPQEILDDPFFMPPSPMPIAEGRANGMNQPITFGTELMPGMEYVVEITSKDRFFDPFMDPFFDPFYMDDFNTDQSLRPHSSMIPYELTLKAEMLPPDEDGFPMGMPPSDFPMEDEEIVEEEPEQPIIEQWRSIQEERDQVITDITMGYSYFDEDFIDQMLMSARTLDVQGAQTGYFQQRGDIDVFKVEPAVNGLYELQFNQTDTLRPRLEVMHYDEEEHLLTPVASTGFMGGIFGPMPTEDDSAEKSLYAGLESGETYILIFENQYEVSLDEYTISSSVIAENPEDAYHGNDSFENAAELPTYTLNGNFAIGGEADYFYMKAEEDQLYGIFAESLETPEHQRAGLPETLFDPVYPMIAIIEDSDGDGELSDDEMMKARQFMPGMLETSIRGSFDAKSGKGYFIVVMNDSFFGDGQTKLTPYRMSVAPAGYSASRQLPFSEIGTNRWATKGFIPHPQAANGIKTYEWEAETSGEVRITMEVPSDIDGVMTLLHKNGERIAHADYYGAGDAEILIADVEAGDYLIEVSDFFGHTSIHPYELEIELNE